MTKPKSDLALPVGRARDGAKQEIVQNIPLQQLRPFHNHPIKTDNNAELERLIESIRQVGTIAPALARPLPNGGYELISGHRRLAACRALGLETMPVILRAMNDDEAVIAMVDANLQRETILPSEKAFAYKMKLDAIKHQGKASAPMVSRRVVAADAHTSEVQVQRYIRLTNLLPALLERVDAGQIAMSPAVELSYLSKDEQAMLLDAMEQNDCTPSHAQSIRLKKLSQAGRLRAEDIYAMMAEQKPNQREQIKLRWDDFCRYFPTDYTDEQIKRDIVQGLELLRRQRAQNRDARLSGTSKRTGRAGSKEKQP